MRVDEVLNSQQVAYLIDRAKHNLQRELRQSLGEVEMAFRVLCGERKLLEHAAANLRLKQGRVPTEREWQLLRSLWDICEAIEDCGYNRLQDQFTLRGMREIIKGALFEEEEESQIALRAWGIDLPEDEEDDDGWDDEYEDDDDWAEDEDDDEPTGDITDDVLNLVRTAHHELGRKDKYDPGSRNAAAIQRLADAIELLANNVEYR